MMVRIIQIGSLILQQFRQLFFYWLIGVMAGALISSAIGSRIGKIAEKLSKGRFILFQLFLSALLGALSPLCMFGTVPIIVSLGRKGVSEHLLASFMVTSILINPNLFLFSFALGAKIAFLRLAVCILCGVIAGVLVWLLYREKPFFDFDTFQPQERKSSGFPPFRKLLWELDRAIVKTAPYLLIGILLTALFEVFIPKSIVVSLFSKNRGFGVLIAASLGVPVYVCGGGTIPLIANWLTAGMSVGSAVAFMLTGPATKFTNLSAVKMIMGMRHFALYLVYTILFAVVSGFAIDFIL